MRKLSKHNKYEYWQCISPAVLANCINDFPSGESVLYHAELVAEGFTYDLEDTAKQFRFARYQKATIIYLAHTQTEENFHSMARYYLPVIYSLVKRIDKIGPLTFATFFQQFIRFVTDLPKPKTDEELVENINKYIQSITNEKS